MFLHSIATAVPEQSLTQVESWEIIKNSPVRFRLKSRSLDLLQKILLGKSGISRRHFAVSDLESLFVSTPDQLHAEFSLHAPNLAQSALAKALDQKGISAVDLDALLVCTCTGYLCPGLSSFIAESLHLRANAFLQDLVGLGCGAAIPSLRAASALAAQNPEAKIAVVAVEVCSAAFYLDDDPGVLISACLFADGAAATIWSGEPPDGKRWRAEGFDTIHRPEDREALRFEQKDGFLRNKLHRSVPQKAASAVRHLYERRSDRETDHPHVLAHPGGRDVVQALRDTLPDAPLVESAEILNNYGNMSSPSVLFVLEKAIQQQEGPSRPLWLTSFGAGFSAHSFHLNEIA